MGQIAGVTDCGNRGGENQDSIGWDEQHALALVADGLGGHSSGQFASRIVKETLLKLAGTRDLASAVMRAHESVLAAAQKDDVFSGMASTIVAVQISQRVGRVVWVGDSRAYLWRGNALSALTRDHSFVEELRDLEGLTETQIRAHPQRNFVTQTLGAGDPVPARREVPLQKGDWILLCSDGLSGELRDHEIGELLAAAPTLSQAAQGLVAAALAKGGRDNISAVLVEYDGPSKRGIRTPLSDIAVIWLAALGGVGLALLIAAGWFWWRAKR